VRGKESTVKKSSSFDPPMAELDVREILAGR
jgi:hypothetical protein